MSRSNVLIDSDKKYDDIMNNYGNKYSLLQFIPPTDPIPTIDIGYMGKNPDSDNPMIPMKLLNNQLHTPESCKMSAAIQFSDMKYTEQKRLDNGSITKTPGLAFTIANGYSNGDVKYFLNHNNHDARAKGVATNFESLAKATNNSGFINTLSPDSAGMGHRFSIEWYGVFIPDKSGSWNFEISSDDMCYVWIGNKAVHIYDETTADIHIIGPQTTPVSRQTLYELIKGDICPIRIQYSNSNTSQKFNLFITHPDNPSKTDSYNLLYSLSEERQLMYYSLVQSTAGIDRFKCYVTEPTSSETNDKLKALIRQPPSQVENSHDDIEVVDVWSLISDISKLPLHGKTYLKFAEPYYSNPSSQQLNLYDGETNGVIQKLYDTNDLNPLIPSNPSVPNVNYFLHLRADTPETISVNVSKIGNSEGIRVVKEIFKGTFDDAVSNPQWSQESIDANTADALAVLSPPIPPNMDREGSQDIIKYVPPGSQEKTFLYSMFDGKSKFKLHINNIGNLVLSYTRKKSPLKAMDGSTIYTSSNESNRFLYYVNTDPHLNKMFYADDLSKNMTFIPYNSNLLQPNGKYIEWGASEPGNTNGKRIIDNPTNNVDVCKSACNNENTCDYFFHSQINKQCILGTNDTGNIFPSQYPELNMNNQADSRLYVKDKFLKKGIRSKTVTTEHDYTKYEYYSNSDQGIDSTSKVGVQSNPEYKDWLNGQNRFLWGVKESFDTQDCTLDPQGCISNIENKKIKPLIEKSAEYSHSVNQIKQSNTDIGSKINHYKQLRTDISNNPIYSFHDTSIDKPKNLLDGMKDDINEMLLQENNMYIAGSIATFTLVVVGILLLNE